MIHGCKKIVLSLEIGCVFVWGLVVDGMGNMRWKVEMNKWDGMALFMGRLRKEGVVF